MTVINNRKFLLAFNLKQKLFNIGSQIFLFNFFSIVLIFKMCKRITQIINMLELQNILSIYLWKCFLISLFAYLIVLLLSLSYSKLFKILSTPILFMGFLILFYFLTLLNLLIFKIKDTLFIQFCLLILLMPIVYKVITNKFSINFSNLKKYKFSMVDLLILVWFIHSLLYFFEYNFNLERLPFGDESGFWFIASKNMLTEGMLKSQITSYSGLGEIHLFGIPFISALPSKMFGVNFVETIFFMPIIIIITLLIFLLRIRVNRWCFLFFYLALVNSFNSWSWISQLCYRLIYGEGICMVFFLLVTHEIIKLPKQNKITTIDFMLMSFCIGLLSLTKPPLSYLSFLFSILFIIIFNTKKNKISYKKYVLSVLALFISLVPFLVWKLYTIIFISSSNYFYDTIITSNFYRVNFQMLKNMVFDLTSNCSDAIYFSIFSLGFILATFRKEEFIHLIAPLSLIIFVFIYYGLVYQGYDSGSSMRYLMHQALALFYLGGMGFQRFIEKLNQIKWPKFVTSAIIFCFTVLFVIRMF